MRLQHMWIVAAIQHSRLDSCEEVWSFETEAEAIAKAKWLGSDTPYQDEKSGHSATEHEFAIFKAVATYRGVLKPKRHLLESGS